MLFTNINYLETNVMHICSLFYLLMGSAGQLKAQWKIKTNIA